MRRFSTPLMKLLLIKGISRALLPLSVVWAIVDWYRIEPLYALIFAALAVNYVIVYILSWTAPGLMNGPWRIRPWQTFVLLINAVMLPIVFNRAIGHLPWGFIIVVLLAFTGLFVSTAIHFHLQEKLPMAGHFARSPHPGPKQIPSPETPAQKPASSGAA